MNTTMVKMQQEMISSSLKSMQMSIKALPIDCISILIHQLSISTHTTGKNLIFIRWLHKTKENFKNLLIEQKKSVAQWMKTRKSMKALLTLNLLFQQLIVVLKQCSQEVMVLYIKLILGSQMKVSLFSINLFAMELSLQMIIIYFSMKGILLRTSPTKQRFLKKEPTP